VFQFRLAPRASSRLPVEASVDVSESDWRKCAPCRGGADWSATDVGFPVPVDVSDAPQTVARTVRVFRIDACEDIAGKHQLADLGSLAHGSVPATMAYTDGMLDVT
jgi:hypothetical protein